MIGRLSVALLFLLAPRVALCFQNEPRGFGKAQFGMSVEQVKKFYPHGTFIAQSTDPAMVRLQIYRLENQALYNLRPCSVQFHFAADKFYNINFNCGAEDKVPVFLKKRFGDPSQVRDYGTFWQGEKTVISFNPQTRLFGFADRELNQAVQQELLGYAIAHQGTAAATPVPTP